MARSPNYPNYDLAASLKHAAKIYGEDGRNKVSRATVATHLGHESLSGPALGKIGALRAYGLLEGTGDELRVTEDAIAALRAPDGSDARKDAIARLAVKPPLFDAVRREYPTKPSKETLVWWLEKQGYSETAAVIAAGSYLSTTALVESLGTSYNSEINAGNGSVDGRSDLSGDSLQGGAGPDAPVPAPMKKATIMQTERELTAGLLSKGASFRLIVSGAVGVKEIERLISKLEIDKEILADDADDDEDDPIA